MFQPLNDLLVPPKDVHVPPDDACAVPVPLPGDVPGHWDFGNLTH